VCFYNKMPRKRQSVYNRFETTFSFKFALQWRVCYVLNDSP
jgi:hypothetical protein